MEHERPLRSLSDDEPLQRLADLLGQSRRGEADLIAHIAEVDERRLYAREACPSMFAYCTERLHLSEAEAYLRIAAARASREHRQLLVMLADGRLHLSGIALLAPHLTPDNRETILERAAHKSKRQIEELVAELSPRVDVPATVRKLPERRLVVRATGTLPSRVDASSSSSLTPTELRPDGVCVRPAELRPDRVTTETVGRLDPEAAHAPAVETLAPGRYKVQFTASAGLREKLERLRALMRSAVPDGDLAAIIDDAVTEKLQRLEARRFGRTVRPGKRHPREKAPARSRASTSTAAPPASRHIPALVRRAVYERDGGRCRYVDAGGRRCTAREGLEFHHRYPFGHGGGHAVENLSLLCKAHNAYLAQVDCGCPVDLHRKTQRGRDCKREETLSVPG